MIKRISINHPSVPKYIKRQAKLVFDLWSKNKIEELRALRDSSKRLEINIYHHSAGTDSYYHDIEGRYYTWAEIQAINAKKLDCGQYFSTVVIAHKEGVIFRKSSLSPNPSLN